MKYKVNNRGVLVIRNDFGKEIFGMNKNNDWAKKEYDHNGKYISYEDDTGRKHNKYER